jgi:hypothetical protein
LNLLKFIFAFIFAFTGSFAFAAGKALAPKPVPVPKIWTQIVCENSTKAVCVAANGLAWLHRENFVIDPVVKVLAASGVTYTLALGARAVMGETPEVVFVLTVGKAGLQAGTMLIVAGVVVAIIGTLASSFGFLLESTTSTAAPEQDEEITRQCHQVLAPFQGPEGILRMQALTPEEMSQILPCIPTDKNLNGFLAKLSEQGQALEKQIHTP